MDIYKEYIKMCKRAEEIQENWIVNCCDLVSSKYNNYVYQILEIEGCFFDSKAYKVRIRRDDGVVGGDNTNNLIWLPRQDQLQDMVKQTHPNPNKFTEILQDLFGFTEFIWDEDGIVNKDLAFEPQSFEQLLLAYVMETNYNKIWNKEEWR